MPNAIDLLRADHERLRRMLPKLADLSLPARERDSYLEAVEKELRLHSLVEEEIFYPAVRDAAGQGEDRDLCFQSIEKHHVMDMLLPELRPLEPAGDAFRAKACALRELVEHHAREEEEELFDRARTLLGDLALQDLGDRIQRRKIDLDRLWDDGTSGAGRTAQPAAGRRGPAARDLVDLNREDERR